MRPGSLPRFHQEDALASANYGRVTAEVEVDCPTATARAREWSMVWPLALVRTDALDEARAKAKFGSLAVADAVADGAPVWPTECDHDRCGPSLDTVIPTPGTRLNDKVEPFGRTRLKSWALTLVAINNPEAIKTTVFMDESPPCERRYRRPPPPLPPYQMHRSPLSAQPQAHAPRRHLLRLTRQKHSQKGFPSPRWSRSSYAASR